LNIQLGLGVNYHLWVRKLFVKLLRRRSERVLMVVVMWQHEIAAVQVQRPGVVKRP
jgi:hypothetical protein